MSPHSVEGAIGYHSDEHLPPIDISLCGGIEDCSPLLFEQSKVSFDDFLIHLEENPAILNNPSLVVRIGESYYKWESAAPIIMSHVLYGRSLPADLTEKLMKNQSGNQIKMSMSAPGSAEKSDLNRKSSWWPFGSRREREEAGAESTPLKNLENELNEVVTEVNENAGNSNANNSRKRRNDTTTSSSSEAESESSIKEKCKKTLRLSNEDIVSCYFKHLYYSFMFYFFDYGIYVAKLSYFKKIVKLFIAVNANFCKSLSNVMFLQALCKIREDFEKLHFSTNTTYFSHNSVLIVIFRYCKKLQVQPYKAYHFVA